MTDRPESPWDECACGDYRNTHPNNRACGLRWMAPDCGCTGFRLAQPFLTQAEAEEFHRNRQREAALRATR